MNAILIDCSLHSIGLGFVKNDRLVEEVVISERKKNENPFFTLLNNALKRHQLDLSQMDVIGYNGGPGSFTGIRVTLSIAKGLAYPFQLPLIGVSSFDMLLSTAPPQFTYLALLSRHPFFYLARRKGPCDWSPIGIVSIHEINPEETFLYNGSNPLTLLPRHMIASLKKKWERKAWETAQTAKPYYFEAFSPIAKSKKIEAS
jgi:tRNA threonylcarbamoyl adenosine modification protein YeaZ